MFVFLVLPMLYPNDTLTGFSKATKTCPATKRYWRPLNSKRSLPVLKWTSRVAKRPAFPGIVLQFGPSSWCPRVVYSDRAISVTQTLTSDFTSYENCSMDNEL